MQAFRSRANLRNVHAGVSAYGGGYWLADRCRRLSGGIPRQSGRQAAPRRQFTCICGVWSGGPDRRALGRFDADVRQPATDNRLTAIVAAYNAAVDAALARIVDDTTAALEASLERR